MLYPIHVFLIPYTVQKQFMCDDIGETKAALCASPAALGTFMAQAVAENSKAAKDETVRHAAKSLMDMCVRQPETTAKSIFVFQKLPPIIPTTESVHPDLLSQEQQEDVLAAFVEEIKTMADAAA